MFGGQEETIGNRILSTKRSNLFSYLPLNDTSGTVAKNYAPARSGINILLNPGMEIEGTTYTINKWTYDAGASVTWDTTAHSGAHAVKISPVGTVIKFKQSNIPVKVGTVYTFSFRTRGDGTIGLATARISRGDDASFLLTEAPAVTGTTYVQKSYTFTVPADSPTVHVEFRTPAATGDIWIDDVILSCNSVDQNIFNGTYYGATLGQPGLGGMSASFSGTNSVKLDKGAYSNMFPSLGLHGSYVIYGKPTLAALTDGVARWLMKFKTNIGDTSNYIDCFKDATNNKVGWQYQSDGDEAIYQITDWSTANWFSLGAAWDVATGLDLYLSGIPIAVGIPIIGTWTEEFSFLRMALGADSTDGSSGGWIGNLQHFAMWDDKLNGAESLRVGRP
jgi:plastocyanin